MPILPWRRPHPELAAAGTDPLPALVAPVSPEVEAEQLFVQELLWTTFKPTSANRDWTLALGDAPGQALSPPMPAAARLRQASNHSLGYARDRERWAGGWGASGPPSPVTPRLRRAASLGSSAGGSSDGRVVRWKKDSRTPSSPSSPSSALTFGQSGSDQNTRGRRPRASSSSDASYLSVPSPTPASLATRYSQPVDSDTSSLRADFRVYRAANRSADSATAKLAESAGPSLKPSKSFSQESWEYQVARNLVTLGKRSSVSPEVSPRKSPTSSRLPTTPLKSEPTDQPSASIATRRQPRDGPLADSDASSPFAQFPTTPPQAGPGPKTRKARYDTLPGSPKCLYSPNPRSLPPRPRASPPPPPPIPRQLARRDSSSSIAESISSEVSWHSAEEEAAAFVYEAEDGGKTETATEQPFEVKSSRSAAVSWTATSPTRTSFTHAVLHTILPLSPPLTPAQVINSRDEGVSDPFSDEAARAKTPTQDNEWCAIDLDDEPSVVIPLPPGPIKSAIPQPFLHSPPNFFSLTPRQLRAAWRREQRDSLTARGPSPITEERTSYELRNSWNALDSAQATFLPPSPITPTTPMTARPTHVNRPSLGSSLASKQNPFHRLLPRPLALVPTGAYLFVFGFVCPPLWWLGAAYPRPARSTTQTSANLTNVRVERQYGPLSEWPDRREGAREPTFDGSRGSGRISKAIEGSGDWWENGTGWRASQQSVTTWRRRNRIMAFVSVFLVAAVIGIAVWAAEQNH